MNHQEAIDQALQEYQFEFDFNVQPYYGQEVKMENFKTLFKLEEPYNERLLYVKLALLSIQKFIRDICGPDLVAGEFHQTNSNQRVFDFGNLKIRRTIEYSEEWGSWICTIETKIGQI